MENRGGKGEVGGYKGKKRKGRNLEFEGKLQRKEPPHADAHDTPAKRKFQKRFLLLSI